MSIKLSEATTVNVFSGKFSNTVPGKIKRTQDVMISGSSLHTIFTHLRVPHSYVQTILHNYKHHEGIPPPYHSGRSRRGDYISVQNKGHLKTTITDHERHWMQTVRGYDYQQQTPKQGAWW